MPKGTPTYQCERPKPFERIHGFGTTGNHQLYNTWKKMKSRCYYVKAKDYHLYGGRGIVVCDRWKGHYGFVNFLNDLNAWDGKPVATTLDRINVNGHYEPQNCRWATHAEQMANRRARVKKS